MRLNGGRLWLFPGSLAHRQQQIICFEDFLPSKDAVIQDLVGDVNKKLGQKHINGTFVEFYPAIPLRNFLNLFRSS